MSLLRYSPIFKELVKTDLLMIKPLIKDKLIDLFIWISTMVVVNTYIMPYFGLPPSYGIFMLASLCSSAGLFEVYSSVVAITSDLEGDRMIDYYLTLPIPSWMIFVRALLHYALNTMIMGFFVLPAGKLLVGELFNLSSISWMRYGIIFIVANFFYGSLVLWTASYVKNMLSVGSVWMRFIYPLWFLGCFQFSWHALYSVSPWLATANLANPMTYVAEGYRAALLGQEGSLNFWWCIVVLIICTIAGAWHAIIRLKKRLDFV